MDPTYEAILILIRVMVKDGRLAANQAEMICTLFSTLLEANKK